MKCGKPLKKTDTQQFCYDCTVKRHFYERGVAVFAYTDGIKQSIYQFKYHDKREYAAFYGRQAARQCGALIRKWDIDLVLPVPMYAAKQRKRGYNQAELIARELSKNLNLICASEILVRIRKTTPMKELNDEERRKNVESRLENGKELFYNDVVVATGGMSYQTTGSDGDGYRFAEEAGLAVTPLRPALVPLETEEAYIRELQGLSLKNVTMTIKNGKKTLFDGFGEMLFTHFGISGPLGLSASSYIGKALEQQPLKGYLNLKPALTEEQLDARILREFEENRNKQFRNVINSLFPAKLLPVMLSLGGIDPYKQVNAVSKAERQHFEELITHFPFTVTGTRGFREAIITQGGVSVKEIRPGTMEAKKKEGLYFVGEVLDLDALTGGFNLQIAWASAHAAAEEIRAKEEQE